MTQRRDFLRYLAAAVGTAAVRPARPAWAQPSATRRADFLVGIQMGPHTILDEGIEPCLDLLRDTAAIDTLFTYSHAYGGDLKKPVAWLATDHGKPPRDQRSRKLPLVWVRHHEQYFKDTRLRHQQVDASYEYANRDLFAEIVAPARARGMRSFARILEQSREIENIHMVATVDVDGRPTQTACWNHPEYKAFWNATVEDLSRHRLQLARRRSGRSPGDLRVCDARGDRRCLRDCRVSRV